MGSLVSGFVVGVVVGLAVPRLKRDLLRMRTAWALDSWWRAVAHQIPVQFEGAQVYRRRRPSDNHMTQYGAYLEMVWRNRLFVVLARVEPGWRAQRDLHIDEREGGFLKKSNEATRIRGLLARHFKLERSP